MSKDKVIYTDIVLQILSLYVASREGHIEEESMDVIQSILLDEEVTGPGLMPGLVFAGPLHLYMILQVIGDMLNISTTDTLRMYASSYNQYRDNLLDLKNLDPSFVNMVADLFS